MKSEKEQQEEVWAHGHKMYSRGFRNAIRKKIEMKEIEERMNRHVDGCACTKDLRCTELGYLLEKDDELVT